MKARRVLAVLIAAVAVVACDATAGPSTTSTTEARPDSTTSTAVTPTAPPTTLAPETTTTSSASVEEWVVPVASQVPASWTEALLLAYGEGEEMLGSSPGGEGLTLGPDYGAQAPDGTWWFIDVAKQRLAHFDQSGGYLGEVSIPPRLLSQGVYLQYQIPHVLADGTVVAQQLGSESTTLLVVRDGEPATVTVPRRFRLHVDDGQLLYGFGDDDQLLSVDPTTGAATEVDWFTSQAGSRYRIDLEDGAIRIRLPDADVDTTVPLLGGNGAGRLHTWIEVATGADGTIHLLVLAINEADESTQLAGYAAIAADGTLSPMEGMRDPFSPADPGSPAHLGVAYGSETPWLMFIDPEGARVYLRD